MRFNPLFNKGLLMWIYNCINSVVTLGYTLSIKEGIEQKNEKNA